jgi:hypothetical protein
MKAIKAKVTNAIPVGSEVNTCDNSGAKVLKVFTVVGSKTTKGKQSFQVHGREVYNQENKESIGTMLLCISNKNSYQHTFQRISEKNTIKEI